MPRLSKSESAKSRGWMKTGRSHDMRYVQTSPEGWSVRISAAPSLYGKWVVWEDAPGYHTTDTGASRRNKNTIAYAGDLREAKRKAEAHLRGEAVERGADTWRNPFGGAVVRRPR